MQLNKFKLYQIVFEAGYSQGYRYLDRCGETMIEIENKNDNWLAQEVSPSRGTMINKQNNIVFNFSSNKLDVVQKEVKDLDCKYFFDQTKTLLNIVSENLGIKEYLRFGIRYWFLYPINSLEDGRQLLSKCKTYNVNNEIEELFGKKIKDTSIVIILEEENNGHRIAISVVRKEKAKLSSRGELIFRPAHTYPKNQNKIHIEQLKEKKEQKENPDKAILIDIDNYNNHPQIEEFDNFITESDSITKDNLIKLIGA